MPQKRIKCSAYDLSMIRTHLDINSNSVVDAKDAAAINDAVIGWNYTSWYISSGGAA